MVQLFSKNIIVFIYAFLLPYTNLNAQTCCTGSAPITGLIKVGAIDHGQFNINLMYDYNSITDLYIKESKINEDYISRSTRTLLLQTTYGINSRLSVGFVLPYVSKTEQARTSSGSFTAGANSLGDLSLLFQYSLVRTKSWLVLVGSGIKFPTGSTQLKQLDSNITLQPTLQPGTGSYDYLFLTQFQYSLASRHSMSLSQSFSYQLTGTSKQFASHISYKFGNELQSFTTLSDQFVWLGKVFTPSVTFRLSLRGTNYIEEFEDTNSGGTWLYFTPGGAIQLTNILSMVLQADVPIYRKVNGFQLTTTYILRGGVLITI